MRSPRAGRARSGSDSWPRCPGAPPVPAGSGAVGAQPADRSPDQRAGHDLHPLQIASPLSEGDDRIARHLGRFAVHFAPAMSIIHSLEIARRHRCISSPDLPRHGFDGDPSVRRHPPRLHAGCGSPVRPFPHPPHAGGDGRDTALAAAEDRAVCADARRADRQPGGAAGQGGAAGDLPVRLAGRGRRQHGGPDVSGPVAVSGGFGAECGAADQQRAAPRRPDRRIPRATTAPTGWRRSWPMRRPASAAR